MGEQAQTILGVSVAGVRNKNEKRVARLMVDVLAEAGVYQPNDLDIQDIYALTLNKLPARYVQSAGLALKEPVADDQIKDAIRRAIERVRQNPTRA